MRSWRVRVASGVFRRRPGGGRHFDTARIPRPPVVLPAGLPRRVVGLTFVLVTLLAAGLAPLSVAASPKLTVVATGLNNPRKIFLGPNGSVYLVEAGTGGNIPGHRCTTTCVGPTGSIVRIEGKHAVPVVIGIGSVSNRTEEEAEGPAAVIPQGSRYDVLMQDMDITSKGVNPLGLPDAGDLISTPAGVVKPRVIANLAAFEAAHNPDHGAGPGPKYGAPLIDSDPYAFVAYRGGWAVVDASADDLLWVHANGQISVLAVFPTQREHLTAKDRATLGPHAPMSLNIRSVPTCVAVGPDGALYVGELTGWPYQIGKARVWRIVPGQRPAVYATGFTTIIDLAFDRDNLLVLEIDSKGLLDATAPGALYRLAPDKTRTLIATAGLDYPTGIAVGNGLIYIANGGIYPGSGAGPHGELVTLPAALGA